MAMVTIKQREVPEKLFGRLTEYEGSPTSTDDLQQFLAAHGYVLLRGAVDAEKVLAARGEVMTRLYEVGEVQEPVMEGKVTWCSQRPQPEDDGGVFWKSVNQGPVLRDVTHGESTREVVGNVLGTPARPHDLMYLRPTAPGGTTSLHYDYPFFAGYARNIVTVWIPIGDVPLGDGPLVVVERSFQFKDLLDPITHTDFQVDNTNKTVQAAAYQASGELHPVDLASQRGCRLLSADFRAGDIMIFSGCLMHGSLDNNSLLGHLRLSCDVRYQPASDRHDDRRYFGDNPCGSKGGGYADMRGARPILNRT